jgi:predicted nuclease with TOPRIM domain
MRTKEKEKLVKTIEKLADQLQTEKVKVKEKNTEIKKLKQEKSSLSEKLEHSHKNCASLQEEVKKKRLFPSITSKP